MDNGGGVSSSRPATRLGVQPLRRGQPGTHLPSGKQDGLVVADVEADLFEGHVAAGDTVQGLIHAAEGALAHLVEAHVAATTGAGGRRRSRARQGVSGTAECFVALRCLSDEAKSSEQAARPTAPPSPPRAPLPPSTARRRRGTAIRGRREPARGAPARAEKKRLAGCSWLPSGAPPAHLSSRRGRQPPSHSSGVHWASQSGHTVSWGSARCVSAWRDRFGQSESDSRALAHARPADAQAGPGRTHQWLCVCVVRSSGPARGGPGARTGGGSLSPSPRKRLVAHQRVQGGARGGARTHVRLCDALRRRGRSCQAPRRARRTWAPLGGPVTSLMGEGERTNSLGLPK